LDPREQKFWLSRIEAGNLYINRSITGAIVRRQPFGGCKASSFGHGAKAGGPNYVHQFAHPTEVSPLKEKAAVSAAVENMTKILEKLPLSTEELGIWYASISNYAFWGHRFKHDHDPSRILGQDNLFQYRSYMGICLRIQPTDKPLDILRTLAAALTCETPIQVSYTKGKTPLVVSDQWKHLLPLFRIVEESEDHFLQRVQAGAFKRIRLLSAPTPALQQAASEAFCHLDSAPVLSNGRFELLHYLREVAISSDYHRYGNLGVREGEVRKPVL
jgi:RHH-type proline utilization regulon transcriptional repressor/proline dehydrogenase/delta 1-pyrroline-5-carboxylate dehydrogenase